MIKYSKDGFEIDHLRYLTDASVGLVFYVIIIFFAYSGFLHFPFISDVFGDARHSTGVKVTEITVSNISEYILIILLFLLHPAIGIVISALSWFLLEALSVWLVEKIIWKHKFVVKMGGVESEYLPAINKFRIEYNGWHGFLYNAEIYLRSQGVELYSIELRRSLRILLRNISFVMLLISVVFIIQNNLLFALYLFILFFCLLVVSCSIAELANISLFIMYYRYYMYEFEGYKIL